MTKLKPNEREAKLKQIFDIVGGLELNDALKLTIGATCIVARHADVDSDEINRLTEAIYDAIDLEAINELM